MLDTLEWSGSATTVMNLVVAATGTGKTVVAALDYRQLRPTTARPKPAVCRPPPEILDNPCTTYRAVLRDGNFGQIHGGGE